MIINNNGPLIVSSDYWGGPADSAGAMFLSTNAGCFRLMLPASMSGMIPEMETGKLVVITRGVFRGVDAVELLFDDGTENPFSLHLGAEQCDRLPLDEDVGKEWAFSAWTGPADSPKMAVKKKAYYRRRGLLPCLQPWGQ